MVTDKQNRNKWQCLPELNSAEDTPGSQGSKSVLNLP